MLTLILIAALLQQTSTTVTVGPPTMDRRGDPEEAVLNRFDPLWDKCSSGVLAHKNDAETASLCKQAADVANSLPSTTHYTERRMVNVYAATAYANIADWKSALPYADHAVEVIEQGHVSGAGAEAAYETRSQIKAFSGDLQGAAPDADKADAFAREMVRGGLSTGQLHKDLKFHAELLRRLNRQAEAQKLGDEEAKLP
jgi:hypothetical protein